MLVAPVALKLRCAWISGSLLANARPLENAAMPFCRIAPDQRHAHARIGCRIALLFALAASLPASATEFVYEGHLDDRGAPANGRYDFQLTPYREAVSGKSAAAPITFANVEVRDGQFRVEFELATAEAQDVWFEVALGDTDSGVFSAIPGRTTLNAKSAVVNGAIGSCWSTTGDAGSSSSTNFLGTTDAQPLVLRTRNVQSLRIEPSFILSGSDPITANVIAGSKSNNAFSGVRGATISGGGAVLDGDPDFTFSDRNRVTDHYGTVSGGYANRAGNSTGTTDDKPFATIGGGRINVASGTSSTTGGGEFNTASGDYSTIAGGTNNTASGEGSSAAGNVGNTASGDYSTAGGGFSNCAGGDFSWAGGYGAKVRPGTSTGAAGFGCNNVSLSGDSDGDNGTFAWADSQGFVFRSTGPDQFLVRANGGIYLGTNSTVSIPTTRFINTSTGAYLSTGGTWTNASSRALKTAFAAVDAADILGRVLALPVQRWSYRASPDEGTHLGPVAEDFRAAFGLGAGADAISTVDADGVALAAIQGLNAKLESENAALRARLAAIEARLDGQTH